MLNKTRTISTNDRANLLGYIVADIVNVQRGHGVACMIDLTHGGHGSLSDLAARGVNIAELLISQPDNTEMACEISHALINSKAIDLIVVLS